MKQTTRRELSTAPSQGAPIAIRRRRMTGKMPDMLAGSGWQVNSGPLQASGIHAAPTTTTTDRAAPRWHLIFFALLAANDWSSPRERAVALA